MAATRRSTRRQRARVLYLLTAANAERDCPDTVQLEDQYEIGRKVTDWMEALDDRMEYWLATAGQAMARELGYLPSSTVDDLRRLIHEEMERRLARRWGIQR